MSKVNVVISVECSVDEYKGMSVFIPDHTISNLDELSMATGGDESARLLGLMILLGRVKLREAEDKKK